MSTLSQFLPYSVGLVAENPAVGAKRILVTPTEKTVVMDGVTKSDPQVLSVKGKDSEGNEYQSEAMTDTTLTAIWLPDSSNRASPPTMRRNMRVQLYRMADSDTFYWRDLGLDADLQRLDTVLFTLNNNPENAGADEVSPENCWFVEFSTHTKKLTIHTNKSNGEPFAYNIVLDAGVGKFLLTDDDGEGNSIVLDSAARHLQAILSTGTEFNLDGNNIYAFAPENINLVAQQNITMECQNYSLVASQSYMCKTQNWLVDCPAGEFTGILKVGGLGTTTARGYNGKAEIDGELDVKRKFTAQEDAVVGGQLRATKVISDQPIDAPNV